ncbi:MAG: DUF4263 domain-containing protein [Deltaproteobacteria bacterium]|nr:DUF4263 domain-containing protein [Deltaproteobacteria bacterium]
MKNLKVKSTSRSSALVDDVVLRATGTTRLVFRPVLVENPSDPECSVKGAFIFQRKGIKDDWKDIEAPPLSALKKDDVAKLDLHSSEIHSLYRELSSLYELYCKIGIPKGEGHFVRATNTLQTLAAMTDSELEAVIGGSEKIGAKAMSRLIDWATKEKNFTLMFDRLEELGEAGLTALNSAVGIATLKRALKQWSDNRTNADEEFWQGLLSSQAFVLEQLFHVPIVIVASKAYVGGKLIDNKGGKIVDFLVKNKITDTLAIIEIKTPVMNLLGAIYRNGIYNISKDLSGAVQQVLTYRDSLSRERDRLLNGDNLRAEVLDPNCIVLIGHARKQLKSSEMKKSFALYRRQLKDVEIVTYDEMFYRTKRLVSVLEQGLAGSSNGYR